MVKTLIWATGYNVVAIPLAAEEFHKAGTVLSPSAGVIIMSISTVIVAIVFLIRWAVVSTRRGHTSGPQESAMEIPKRRYARCEVDREEFQEKMKDLRG